MRKIIFGALILLFVSLVLPHSSFAAVKRYTTCDACGLCPQIDVTKGTCSVATTPAPDQPPQVPGDWKNCVKCLYPGITKPDPSNCNTVLVNEKADPPAAPTVMPGRQYTMLGCLTSGTTKGFRGETGAPTFVQALLNVIFSLAGGLAFLYLMYGGFIILTSQADPEKLNYGRRLIYGAIAGLIITLGSVFIVNLIGSGILRIPGFTGVTTPTP